ncbi:lymphocyte function-associated antigen 3-like, partial [Mantella aurantiaca]
EVIVESLVYSSALLPCWFPFIQGEENLLVIWEKVEKDGTSVQVYKFVDGRSDLSNQDSQFRGRTDLSGDLSQGNLELTLTGVSLNDGGVYHCRAANNLNHGDKMAVLSVSAPPQEKIETVIEGNVTLVPKYFGVPTEITWKRNSDLLVEMEMAKPKPHFYRLADRAHLDRSGSLTIRYLTKEDSGIYKSEVLITRNIQETEIHLSVLDRVSKPLIYDNSTGQKIILRCVSSTLGVTYKWVKNRVETVSTEPDYIAPRARENVEMSCTVNNTVSEDSESISILLAQEYGRHHFSIGIAMLVFITVVYLSYKRFRIIEIQNRREWEPALPTNPKLPTPHTLSSDSHNYSGHDIKIIIAF